LLGHLLVQGLGVFQTELQDLVLRLDVAGVTLEAVELDGKLVELGIF
jgi:hypothetical protein